MALKTHIIARRWEPEGTASEHIETLCGEWAFKGRGSDRHIDREWTAGRRIGGLVAVPELDFYPDRDACGKCKARWMAGAEC